MKFHLLQNTHRNTLSAAPVFFSDHNLNIRDPSFSFTHLHWPSSPSSCPSSFFSLWVLSGLNSRFSRLAGDSAAVNRLFHKMILKRFTRCYDSNLSNSLYHRPIYRHILSDQREATLLDCKMPFIGVTLACLGTITILFFILLLYNLHSLIDGSRWTKKTGSHKQNP